MAVYLPPHTDASTNTALNELYRGISKQENAHSEAAFLEAGDFNAGKLTSVYHIFYQLVTCASRGDKTLGHLYSTPINTYKALSLPPFDKSDHYSILLRPAYKQKLKKEVPVTRRKWSNEVDAKPLQRVVSTSQCITLYQAVSKEGLKNWQRPQPPKP